MSARLRTERDSRKTKPSRCRKRSGGGGSTCTANGNKTGRAKGEGESDGEGEGEGQARNGNTGAEKIVETRVQRSLGPPRREGTGWNETEPWKREESEKIPHCHVT